MSSRALSSLDSLHQALAQADGHSLHLTFSTYQRHTWRELLVQGDDARELPLSRRAHRALEALRAPAPAARADQSIATSEEANASNEEADDGEGRDQGTRDETPHTTEQTAAAARGVLRGEGLLFSLPRDLMHTHTIGVPDAGWRRCASYLTPSSGVPFWLSTELWGDGALGGALDALALRYLQHSLPPLGCAGGGGGGDDSDGLGGGGSEQEPSSLNGSDRIRLFAPHCARLVDSARTRGDWASWEAGDGPVPSLELHHNLMNGRAFAEPPSPAFEVLPSVGRSVAQLLQSGSEGVLVSSLAAYSSNNDEARADLLDLLELCMEHGVFVRCPPSASADEAEQAERRRKIKVGRRGQEIKPSKRMIGKKRGRG